MKALSKETNRVQELTYSKGKEITIIIRNSLKNGNFH